MAAVRVVLPWSMCPIVPTLTCGLVLEKISFAIGCSAPYGIPDVNSPAEDRPAAHTNPPLVFFSISSISARAERAIQRSGADRWRRDGHSLTLGHRPKSCRWDLNP